MPVANWNNADLYWCQDKNAEEAILKKKGLQHWLETCGSTCLGNAAFIFGVKETVTPGGWKPRNADLATLYLNTPSNYPKLKAARADIDPSNYLGNEIPQYYPIAAKEVFGLNAVFQYGMTTAVIKGFVDQGKVIQICLNNPGHFVLIVNYDSNNFIMWDPWAGRYPDGTGFCKPLGFDQISTNTGGYAIIYG